MLSLLLCALAAAETAPTTVLVLDLRPLGVDAKVVGPLGNELAEIVGRHAGYRVVSQQDVRDVLTLEETRQSADCEADAECLAAVSRVSQASRVLGGGIGAVGKSFVVTLSLFDPERGVQLSTVSETVDALDDARAALPRLVEQLFGWSTDAPAKRFALPNGAKSSFAVFDMQASGVSDALAATITQVLSVEVKRLDGATVVSRDDIAAMLQLQAQKDLLGCSGDQSCLAEIGGALGVDRIIVGQVSMLGGTYVIGLRLIAARSVQVENRVTESFRGSEEQVLRAVRSATRRLLGIEPAAAGTMAITASQEAEVFVDEEKRGDLPLAPIAGLGLGRHHVRLAKSGFLDWQSDIYVDPSETTVVWAELTEQPARWYQQWWVWAVAGGVAALGLGATLYLTSSPPATSTGTVVVR